MPLRWYSRSKLSGVSLPYTWTNSSEQRSIEHGGRPTDARYTPEAGKHLRNSHLNISSDSSTFINHGQGLGYPPKAFIDRDSDQEFPPTHSNTGRVLQNMPD